MQIGKKETLGTHGLVKMTAQLWLLKMNDFLQIYEP